MLATDSYANGVRVWGNDASWCENSAETGLCSDQRPSGTGSIADMTKINICHTKLYFHTMLFPLGPKAFADIGKRPSNLHI